MFTKYLVFLYSIKGNYYYSAIGFKELVFNNRVNIITEVNVNAEKKKFDIILYSAVDSDRLMMMVLEFWLHN